MCPDRYEFIKEFRKMSLTPSPCQEYNLNGKGSTNSESIEWLLDLRDKIPIWSRLKDINTSGFMRKLPMSMNKNYDIEIKGRLWSLWGHEHKHRKPQNHSKSYMAITVMALCAARVISLNIWSSNLMDSIRINGRTFYKESLSKKGFNRKEFQLNSLATVCNLEGINFEICLDVVRQGHLYSIPINCQPNLAYALIQFFAQYQFGILECYNRVLGFGIIDGPSGGYFMYDAQSLNFPLFLQNCSAPYLLRTNHLQVLLYCLVVSLNVPQIHAPFSLYHVQINLKETNQNHCKSSDLFKSTVSIFTKTRIPSSISNLKISSDISLCLKSSTLNSDEKLPKFKSMVCEYMPQRDTKLTYRRKFHNITKEEEEKSIIKPFVDADRRSTEDLQLKKDFVRVICSDTALPLTSADVPDKPKMEFCCNLLDALVIGPETCLAFSKL